MASISTWYHNQYSTWNRTRHLRSSSYLARAGTQTSPPATPMEAVIINMDFVGDTTSTPKKEKKQETLFGPNIGVVSPTPQWVKFMGQKPKVPADNISSNIIQNWITRSKEPSQPTTTLQALVNLKRPTLRLCPLTISSGDDPELHLHSNYHHGLEFEYDCDAPKCRIDIHVVLPAEHPCAGANNVDNTGYSRISIFESVVDGGFGKVLQLEEGAALELGRFEHTHTASQPDHVSSQAASVPKSPLPSDGVESIPASSAWNDRARKRFSGFSFRKRSVAIARAVSGPDLAVVDADASPNTWQGSNEKEHKEDMKDGVRVTIKLSALDDDGIDMSLPNEQVTYLHVVRLGAAPVEHEDHARPWVVKVVKREATIGPHTFHLHEIYGLSSQPSQPQATCTSSDAHTYPPASPPPVPVHEDEPSSECLLCLSSPREVILLPCRHLVACKDCAINMVEFGAGGNIIQAEDTPAPTTGGVHGETSVTERTAPVTNAVPQNVRRKRKAKGWFCPVCRQPYTSLLRISTSPPTKDICDDENRASAFIGEHEREDDGQMRERDEPLSGAPGAGGMFSSIRSGLMRLNPTRFDGRQPTQVTEAERPTEVPASVV